jgi:hypothetical protein
MGLLYKLIAKASTWASNFFKMPQKLSGCTWAMWDNPHINSFNFFKMPQKLSGCTKVAMIDA